MLPNPQIAGYFIEWFYIVIVIDITVSFLFMRQALNSSVVSIKNRMLILFFILMVCGGFFGARLFAMMDLYVMNSKTYEQDTHHLSLNYLFDVAGLNWYGGLIVDLLITLGFSFFIIKNHKFYFIDIVALTCCLAYSIGRWACFLSGDSCHGKWTTLPWGVHIKYGENPQILPVHPTAIYESIIHIILLVILFYTSKQNRLKPGILT